MKFYKIISFASLLFFLISKLTFSQFQSFGLEGKVVNDIKFYFGILYAATDSGVYKRSLMSNDTTWHFLGLDRKKVNSIYPHETGPVVSFPVLTVGISPTFTPNDSALIYCKLDDTSSTWAITDTGIDRNEASRIISIDGFPSPLICGETFAGGNGKLYKRGMNSWYEKVFDIGVGQLNVVRTNLNTGDVWVGGETAILAPYISKSTDLGNTWLTTYPNLGGDNACYSFWFDQADTNIIYAGMEGIVIKSTDGGNTWNPTGLTNTPYYFFSLAYSFFNNILFAGGSTNTNNFGLYMSSDNGNTWSIIIGDRNFKGISSMTIMAGVIPEDYTLLIGTFGDGVLSYRIPIVSINEEKNTIKEFSLKQNYPNPFNSSTIIEFGIMEKGNVRMSILNLLGEEIIILLDEEREASYHSIDFNSSDLPSGVYFYRIHVGNFIDTKKMLLLK